MKKFTTDLRFANYICALLKNGEKVFVSKFPSDSQYHFRSDEIDRELTQQEYMDFIEEKGFVKGAMVSKWTNQPSAIQRVEDGAGFHTQPFIITYGSYGEDYPRGAGVELYNMTLVVPTPTEFWHYRFKKRR